MIHIFHTWIADRSTISDDVLQETEYARLVARQVDFVCVKCGKVDRQLIVGGFGLLKYIEKFRWELKNERS